MDSVQVLDTGNGIVQLPSNALSAMVHIMWANVLSLIKKSTLICCIIVDTRTLREPAWQNFQCHKTILGLQAMRTATRPGDGVCKGVMNKG